MLRQGEVGLGQRAARAAPSDRPHQDGGSSPAGGEEVVELLLGVDGGDEAAAAAARAFGSCGFPLDNSGGRDGVAVAAGGDGGGGRRRGFGPLSPLAVRRGVEGGSPLGGGEADVV